MERDTAIRSADLEMAYFDLNNASEERLNEIIELNADMVHELIQKRPFERLEDVASLPNFSEDDVDALRRAGASIGQPSPVIGAT